MMSLADALPTSAIFLIDCIHDCLDKAVEATTLEEARSHIRESFKYVDVLLAEAHGAAEEVGSKA